MNAYIGERIKNLRINRGLTLKDLGDRIDYNFNSLSRIERGVNAASPELLKKLADFFGVSVSYFFGEEIQTPKELEGLGIDAIIIAKELRDESLTTEEMETIKNFVKFIKQNKKG